VALHPEKFTLAVLAAHGSWQVIVEQRASSSARRPWCWWTPGRAWRAAALRDSGSPTRVGKRSAEAAREAVAAGNVDVVMAAIVGAAGLPSTLAAVRAAIAHTAPSATRKPW